MRRIATIIGKFDMAADGIGRFVGTVRSCSALMAVESSCRINTG
jgi:hypothetical protein